MQNVHTWENALQAVSSQFQQTGIGEMFCLNKTCVIVYRGEDISLLDELKTLSKDSHYDIIECVHQKGTPESKHILGQGKLNELKKIVEEKKPNVIIFENDISIGQRIRLSKEINAKIIDKFDLVLEIFLINTGNLETRYQLEILKIKRMLPNIPKLKRLGYLKRIEKLKEKLESDKKIKENLIKKRSKLEIPVVSVAGYTNSGKSSLINAISNSEELVVKNQLFTTLNTKARRVEYKDKTLVFCDTVGFIRNLPHELINAFYSTISEIKTSDLCLIVVDVSDKDFEIKLRTVVDTLKKDPEKVIIAFNKIDKIEKIPEVDGQNFPHVFISAKEKTNLMELIDLTFKKATKEYIKKNIEISYKKYYAIKNKFNMENESFGEKSVKVTIIGKKRI